MNNDPPILDPNSEPLQNAGSEGPSAEQVLAHLETVLKSHVFSGAARQQRLLRHLVTRRLQGATGELKEYALGVEVFDRGDDFDPRLDPIVRVEASRLRSRLQKYYGAFGAKDGVRIALPRGAYLPSFASSEPFSPPAPPDTARIPEATSVRPVRPLLPSSRGPSRRPVVIGVGILAAASLSILLVRKTGAPSTAPDYINFKRVTSEGMLCASPAFSPDAKSLVYARREAGKWDLYRRDLTGLAFTNLTQGSGANNRQPAWSPDGKRIAFQSDRDGGGIFLLDPLRLSVSKLTTSGHYPSWSPDSQKIVFSTQSFTDPAETAASQPSSLRIVDVRSRQISSIGGADSSHDAIQPVWSPHGNRIAFWGTDRNGNRDVWTIASNEPADPIPVTHDSWTDWSPAWSPDGQFLYLSSDRGGAMNLWRVRIDEDTGEVRSHPEPVTTPSSYSGWTAFARNGQEFAYVHRLVSSQLYKAPFAGDKATGSAIQFDQRVQLTAGERSVREPEMSPDGDWIVLRVQDPQEDLALIRPDGSDLHRITNDKFSDRTPHWAPDGKKILFISNRSGRFELWSIHPDGSGLRQLTERGAMYYAWTPDGTLVGYPEDSKPVALDPPGGKLSDWGLPSIFRPIAWSPNRKSVVGRMRSNAFGAGSLFICTWSSGDYWEIAPNASYPSTVWLNDGQKLLFSRGEGVFLADLQTHQLHQQASSGSAGLEAEMHSRFTLSRDDRFIFFVLSQDEEDIWIGSE